MADIARLTAELALLDEERAELDRRLRDAADRRQHSGEATARDQAERDSATLVRAMDDLMTRIRVAESKLNMARQGRKLPWV